MKLKALLVGCLIGLTGSTFAAAYTHPETQGAKDAVKSAKFIPNCEIKVVNHSFYSADVFGTFDDGGTVNFTSYPYSGGDTIEMYYYDPYLGYYYCHAGMNINIFSGGQLIYGQYTPTNQVIKIRNSFGKKIQASVGSK